MPTNKQEYEYGLAKELLLKPVLEKFCGKELQGTKQYDTFDFIGEDVTIELKSRKNNKDKYPTTIVGMNKIDKIQEGERVIFAFNFWDGLYYWEYKENDFDIIMIQRRDRRYIPAKPHLSIPISQLVEIK
tara:strand:+ start:1099 stop:1488 length:390 start_codon:yes stop_codon:yes gene_type:complete